MANTKISALTENASPALEDLLVTIDDPTGTPASRKTAISDLLALEDPILLARYGEGRARNTINALTMANRDFIGPNGLGNPNMFPTEITASQSGTTVTASAAFFRKEHVGAIIRWDTGEQAVITDIDNSGASWAAITTATVDRSQTVASGTATVDAPHVVGVTYGDSVGNRISPALAANLWRTIGYGGIVIGANNVDQAHGTTSGGVSFAGGAADNTDDANYANHPWGARWSLPSGGTISIVHGLNWSPPDLRTPRSLLTEDEIATNAVTLVWRLGAGSFVVKRKRRWDPDDMYETVDTIADASTSPAGTTYFGFKHYTHDLSADWFYQIEGTGGTVYIQAMAFLNNTRPGFVYWPMSRGGELISDFDQMSSDELAELCMAYGQPRFRTIMSFDTTGSTDPATYKAVMDTDRTLWAAAAPLCDHIWMTGYEASSNEAEQEAWDEAMISVAVENSDPLIPLRDLFGSFATSSGLGMVEDGVHPSIRGGAIIAWQFLRTLGLADTPVLREGRDVSARQAEIGTLSLDSSDLDTRLRRIRERPSSPVATGARWQYGACGSLICEDALSSAIGSGDITYIIDLDALTNFSEATHLLTVNDSLGGLGNVAGTFALYVQSDDAFLELRDGSAVSYRYRLDKIWSSYGGARRMLAIRTDVANIRIDPFIDGKPARGCAIDINVASGDPLGTWTGVGTDVAIHSNLTSSSSSPYIHNVMLFLSRLTDAQILEVYERGLPPSGVTPEFWWNFSEQGGRAVVDRTGQGRDAIWQKSNPQQYNITEPDWNGKLVGLGPAWVADINAVTTLVSGDDMINKQTSARDWTLPATPSVGDFIRIVRAGSSSGAMRFAQPALHQIVIGAGASVGTDATTIGTSGKLEIDDPYGSVTLMCIEADAGVSYKWAVTQSAGSLTWT